MTKNHLLLLCCVCLFSSCRKNKTKDRLVDPGLEVYVSRFFEEAALRNVAISDDNLEVVFKDLTAEGVCGLGFFKFEGTDLRRVEISDNLFCWDIQDEFGRESLVFHELGHAILKRTHRDAKLPSGLPADLMCDGNVCDIFDFYDKYTLGKRAYYLDELFNPATPVPIWGRLNRKATVIFEEDMEGKIVEGMLEVTDPIYATNFSQSVAQNLATSSKILQLDAEDILDNPVSANWIYRIEEVSISEGAGLKLSAKISTQQMVGEGIVLAIRVISVDNGVEEVTAATSSRNQSDISGTSAEKLYELSLPYAPAKIQRIELIFQIAPNTSGRANLDDVQLSITE